MKRIIFKLSVTLFLFLPLALSAALLPGNNAVEQAVEWMKGNPVMGSVERSVASITTFPETGYGVYIVELSPCGYLVLNSDDALPLVVSFSADSSVDLSDVPGNAFRAMLLQHAVRMTDLLNNPVALKSLQKAPDVGLKSVTELYGPFMDTFWNQNYPYNKFCPTNPAGTVYYGYHAAAGCVAVAYAQVMNFHCWPLYGEGSHTYDDDEEPLTGTHYADFSDTYDWGNMQKTYSAYQSSPEEQEDAVAELMYEIGVVAEANYKTDGTSAYTLTTGTKLKDYFYYEECNTYYPRYFLIDPLEADLRAGFPCVVSIPGHAIVADGLMVDDGVTTYHINYGWGTSNNGWWSADNVAGAALEDGVTSIRPELMAFPVEGVVTGAVNGTVELQWVLPKRRESEVNTLSVYSWTAQPGLWSSDASELPGDNDGWSIDSARTGDGWYSGDRDPATMVLDEVLVPDASTVLSFWNYIRIYDGVFSLSVSTNSGESFNTLLSRDHTYDYSWAQTNISLSAYAGQQLQLKFELSSCGSYYPGGGVWIDDLSVNSGTWSAWELFHTDSALSSYRFSSSSTEWDDCDDLSIFDISSTTTYKDWLCVATGGVDSCFYKQPGGYSNREYHLTSLSTITPASSSRLLFRAKYKLYLDSFKVLVSVDGSTFTELWSAVGEVDWSDISVDLSGYAGQDIYVRFEYETGSYYTTGGVWIDSVSIEEVTCPEYEVQPVHYSEITNVAAGEYTLKAVLTDTNAVDHVMGPAFTLTVIDDNDGMPTWWEELYGLDPYSDDGDADPDGDTFSNRDEYITGTHPGQGSSFFAIDITGTTISWPAISDRTYRVKYADNPQGPYQVLQSLSGPTDSYLDSASAPRRFYKVDVSE